MGEAARLAVIPRWPPTNKPDTLRAVAAIISRHPDRGPTTQDGYLKNDRMFEPLWKLLPATVLEQVRVRNYERLFDRARTRVRAWEATQARP